MDIIVEVENGQINGDGEKMSFFLNMILPPVIDRFLALFFIGCVCNYFFWKIVSFIFSTNYNSAIASYCFFILFLAAIDAVVRGAQGYSMLDFALLRKSRTQ